MMAGIRSKDTRPEMIIRRGLHQLGFRYRLHDKRLPGHPDLVFSSFRTVLFIHGCFWHKHECEYFKWPTTRTEFWKSKLTENETRDRKFRSALEAAGWNVLVVWECEIRNTRKDGCESVINAVAESIRKSNIGRLMKSP